MMTGAVPVQPEPSAVPAPEATVRSRRSPRHPHVITITSGKGGVGKSNIAANLASQLRSLRRRVMVMDADLSLANIDILLGLAPRYNISHVLSGEKQLRDILVPGPGGIQILPASSGVIEARDLDEHNKMLLMQQMESLQSEFDYLLIDTEAGISNNVLYFALAAQTTIVIVTPEPTSLSDAYALIKVLSTSYRQHDFKVVANEVAGEFEALQVYRQLTTATDRFLNVSIDLLGYVPRDGRVREAVRAQKTFMELYPSCNAAKAIKKLAREVLAMESDPMKSDLGLLWRNMLVSSAA